MEVDFDEPSAKRPRQAIQFVPGEKKHQIHIPSDLRMSNIDQNLVAQELAPKGWKKSVKRKREEEDLNPITAEDADNVPNVDISMIKNTTREATGLGKVSNRPWKVPAKRASEAKTNPVLKTSWDRKMAEKKERQAFLEHKRTKTEERKEKLSAERQRLSQVKAQKEANRLKSQVVQKVSTATAKRMMKDKKKKKLLKTMDTDAAGKK